MAVTTVPSASVTVDVAAVGAARMCAVPSVLWGPLPPVWMLTPSSRSIDRSLPWPPASPVQPLKFMVAAAAGNRSADISTRGSSSSKLMLRAASARSARRSRRVLNQRPKRASSVPSQPCMRRIKAINKREGRG